MANLSLSGGVRMGRSRASAPLATLIVTPDLLEIKSAIGYVCFQPEDVVAFKVQRSWGRGYGLVIEHSLPNYPQKVLFADANPEKLLEKVVATGFGDPAKTSANAPQLDPNRHGGFPLHTWVLLVGYGLLFGGVIVDWFRAVSGQTDMLIGWGAQAALSLLFAGLLAIRFLPAVQARVFKPGMGVAHARIFLNFLLPLTGILLLILSLVIATWQPPA